MLGESRERQGEKRDTGSTFRYEKLNVKFRDPMRERDPRRACFANAPCPRKSKRGPRGCTYKFEELAGAVCVQTEEKKKKKKKEEIIDCLLFALLVTAIVREKGADRNERPLFLEFL